MAITAQELIDRGRQRGDFQNNPYLNDATEVLPWAKESYKELYDIMIEAYGEDYFQKTALLTADPVIEVDISTIDPPFYKPIRLERRVNLIGYPLRRFNMQDWVYDHNAYSWADRTDIVYHLSGKNIFFQPRPSQAEEVVLVYVPQAILETLTSEIDWTCEPWSEYIVIDLAIKMRRKEQTDTTDLMMDKAEMKKRIISAVAPRDAMNPMRAVDIRSEGCFSDRWWGDPWFT